MTALSKTALGFSVAGLLVSVYSLFNSSALSMMVFFMLAVPCFGAGFALYAAEVIRDLREHRVL